MAQSEVESDEELENPVHHIQVESCTLGLTPLFFVFFCYLQQRRSASYSQKNKQTVYSPKSCMEHNPRTPHVVFRGGEEAVFSQGHIADERQDEHGDAQDNQTQGLGDADHLGSVFIPCV